MTASRALPERSYPVGVTDPLFEQLGVRSRRGYLETEDVPARYLARRGARRAMIEADDTTRIVLRAVSASVITPEVHTRHSTLNAPRKRRTGLMLPVAALAALLSVSIIGPRFASATNAPDGQAAPILQTSEPVVAATDEKLTADIADAPVLTSANDAATAALEAQAALRLAQEEALNNSAEMHDAIVAAKKRGSVEADVANEAGVNALIESIKPSDYLLPTTGRVSDEFGWRIHPVYRYSDWHNAVDMASPCGTVIVAARAGTVLEAGWSGGLGRYVEISHGNVFTGYGHLSQITVAAGDYVEQGQVIGYMGSSGVSTGCHLHWVAISADGYFDPLRLVK